MTLHSVVIQKLLSTNAHIGRRVISHHFNMYTYGIRNGQIIIDSDKTLICLRNACNFLSILARNNASVMFINTNPLYQEIIDLMTTKISNLSPERVNNLWRMGGFLTNSFNPKKFKSRNKKLCFGPPKLPDCLVVFDTERKSSAVLEADRMQIPIVALVDSSMPWEIYKRITYPVPANDSVQFVYLFCNMITKCFMLEKKKKKGDRVKRIGAKTRSGEEVIEQSHDKSNISNADREVFIVPYDDLVSISKDLAETKKLLDKLVVVKFNGSLGTDMGFSGPKSLMEVQNGLTLLDLTVNQVKSINSKFGCNVPLFLLNTNETHNDIEKVVEKYSNSNIDIHSFVQGQQVQQELLGRQDDEYESYPSDHGTVFLSLMKGGTLDVLLSQGKEYALVVDSDNAAAVIDPKILNHVTQNKIEYCVEVTPTTSTDLSTSMVNSHQGKFKLADIARYPDKRVKKFKFVDTRSLWVDLKAIKRLADTDELKMDELIKALNVEEKSITGSAIQFFDQAIGISVPQSRFLPINSTSDFLLIQSDLFTTSTEGVLVRNPGRTIPRDPYIDLGPEFEEFNDFRRRFKSIPSIVGLDSLKVTGDVWFGADITLKGKVRITPIPGMLLRIPDGVVLKDEEIIDPSDF